MKYWNTQEWIKSWSYSSCHSLHWDQDIIHKHINPKVLLPFLKGKAFSMCGFFFPNYEIKPPSSNPDILLPLAYLHVPCGTLYWWLWKSFAENMDTFFQQQIYLLLICSTKVLLLQKLTICYNKIKLLTFFIVSKNSVVLLSMTWILKAHFIPSVHKPSFHSS